MTKGSVAALLIIGSITVGAVMALWPEQGPKTNQPAVKQADQSSATSQMELASVDTSGALSGAKEAQEKAVVPATGGGDVDSIHPSSPPPPSEPLPQYLEITFCGRNNQTCSISGGDADCSIQLLNRSTATILKGEVLVRLKIGPGLVVLSFGRGDCFQKPVFTSPAMESWMLSGSVINPNLIFNDSDRQTSERFWTALKRFRQVICSDGFACPRIQSGGCKVLAMRIAKTSEAPSEDSPESRNPLSACIEAKAKNGEWQEVATEHYTY